MTPDEGPLCFCPVELDGDGEIEKIITGMNLYSDRLPGKVVAVVHENGQEAVDRWLAANEERVAHLKEAP